MATTFEYVISKQLRDERITIKSFQNIYNENDVRYNATQLLIYCLQSWQSKNSTEFMSEILQFYNMFVADPNKFFRNFARKVRTFIILDQTPVDRNLEKIQEKLPGAFSVDDLLEGTVRNNAKKFTSIISENKNKPVLFPFAVGFATQQTIPANAKQMKADSFIFMPSGFETRSQYNPRQYGIKKQNIITAVSVIRPVYFETNQSFNKDNLVAYCLNPQGDIECILITGIKISVKSQEQCRASGGEYIENLALTKKWNGTQYVNQPEWGVCIE